MLQAGRELELVHAITTGVANAVNGKEDKAVGAAIGQLGKKAYPVRYD